MINCVSAMERVDNKLYLFSNLHLKVLDAPWYIIIYHGTQFNLTLFNPLVTDNELLCITFVYHVFFLEILNKCFTISRKYVWSWIIDCIDKGLISMKTIKNRCKKKYAIEFWYNRLFCKSEANALDSQQTFENISLE